MESDTKMTPQEPRTARPRMKAVARDRWGPPDVLRLEDAERPQPTEEQVLVRVHASSVNAYDWHMLSGKPYIARLGEGLRTPKTRVLGLDVAGIAEAVGTKVTDVKRGDRVFGARTGAFAEYIAGKNIVPMPNGLSFEEAAAVPTAGLTALQAVRDRGGVQPGHRVLVNGAGGGVGHFAVQIAKAFGAEVTAVTRAENAELMRSLGADHVIDYAREDFTRGRARYDVILDAGGNRSLSSMRRVVTSTGRLVLIAPARGQWIGPVVRIVAARLTSRFREQKAAGFLSRPNRDDYYAIKALIEAGKVRAVIDRTYPLAEVAEAIRYVEAGHARGKVVVTV